MTKLGFLFICICAALGGLLAFIVVKTFIVPNLPKAASPSEQISNQKSVNEPIISNKVAPVSDKLGKSITAALEGSKGSYAVVVKNLRTGETFRLNENQEFQSASLYKLWVMATATKQIETGALDPNEQLSDTIAGLNADFGISSESAELTKGSISLRVVAAEEQMITISHNYAAMLLSKRVKLSNVSAFLKDHHYDSSQLGDPPKTSASDIAQFFDDLYHGKLGNEESTHTMLAILKRQTLNHKLPLYLPKNVEIAHKTGELEMVTHDGGIVFSNKGDYIIVVLSESTSPAGAEERIGKISKAVYDYFASK